MSILYLCDLSLILCVLRLNKILPSLTSEFGFSWNHKFRATEAPQNPLICYGKCWLPRDRLVDLNYIIVAIECNNDESVARFF